MSEVREKKEKPVDTGTGTPPPPDNGRGGGGGGGDGGGGDDWKGGGDDHEYQDSFWKGDGSSDHSDSEELPGRKRPPTPYHADLEVAQRVNDGVAADLDKFPERRALFNQHFTYVRWADELSGDYGIDTQKMAVEEIITKDHGHFKLPEQLKHIDPKNITASDIEKTKDFIHGELVPLTNKLYRIRRGKHGPDKPYREPSQIEAEATAAAEKAAKEHSDWGTIGRWGNKLWKWHQSHFDGWKHSHKMAFGWCEMLIGSTVMSMGGRLLVQSYHGLKENVIKETGEDGKPHITFEVAPMSAAERTLKFALGGAGVAVGGFATGAGLVNAFTYPE